MTDLMQLKIAIVTLINFYLGNITMNNAAFTNSTSNNLDLYVMSTKKEMDSLTKREIDAK
jgi:hypothetical protein